MTSSPYNPPCGGLPPQTALMTGRAVFTEAYAVIPRGVMSDIVTSVLPFWEGTQAWMLARPLSGFSETFAQSLMAVAPGGGSDRPEPDPEAEGVLFVVEGQVPTRRRRSGARPRPRQLRLSAAGHRLEPSQRRDGPRPLPLDPQGLRAGAGHRGAAGLRHP